MKSRSMSSRKRSAQHVRGRSTRPVVEGLEERLLLYSTTGDLWTHPQRVTYSFIPDNTSVGGVPSTLFKTMSSAGATATWQAQIRKAAAIWEVVANIDLVQVSDNGAAIGGSGYQQGDSRFGDIRIGAIPEQSGAHAMTFYPPPDNGGTVAGDMFFNSKISWQINSGYDIETVALHEFGHALGMSHSQVQQAVLYATYSGIKQTPDSDDTSGIAAIYGPVPNKADNNGTISTATDVTSKINANAQVALPAQLISSSTDQDFFRVTVPASTTGTMKVSMQTTALSSLAPRVTVYNSSGQGLAQDVNTNGYSTTAVVTISNVTPGQVYYIRAAAANAGAGSVGTYGLLINFGSKAQSPIAPPNTTVASTESGTSGTSSNETTGSGGGLLGDLVTGLLDTLGYVLNDVVHIGSLTGAGDALKVSPAYAKHHPMRPHHQTHSVRTAPHVIGKTHPIGNLHRPVQHPHLALNALLHHHGRG